MNEVLARWNGLPAVEAENEILACCGSREWARRVVRRRPVTDEAALLSVSDEIWRSLTEADGMEAFRGHPRIGESCAAAPVDAQSAAWSAREQGSVAIGADAVKTALAEGNREYERRFGHIFIICATGKSGAEILEVLRRRLQSDGATELREAAEQQRQITQIRLKTWVA